VQQNFCFGGGWMLMISRMWWRTALYVLGLERLSSGVGLRARSDAEPCCIGLGWIGKDRRGR
jgi:hypothetical protein